MAAQPPSRFCRKQQVKRQQLAARRPLAIMKLMKLLAAKRLQLGSMACRSR
jgi:hypothetical protein